MTALPHFWQLLKQVPFLYFVTEPSSFSVVATEASFRGDFPVPPPYSVATSLPTYDEAEKAKAAAMAASTVEVMPRVHTTYTLYSFYFILWKYKFAVGFFY